MKFYAIITAMTLTACRRDPDGEPEWSAERRCYFSSGELVCSSSDSGTIVVKVPRECEGWVLGTCGMLYSADPFGSALSDMVVVNASTIDFDGACVVAKDLATLEVEAVGYLRSTCNGVKAQSADLPSSYDFAEGTRQSVDGATVRYWHTRGEKRTAVRVQLPRAFREQRSAPAGVAIGVVVARLCVAAEGADVPNWFADKGRALTLNYVPSLDDIGRRGTLDRAAYLREGYRAQGFRCELDDALAAP